MLHSVKKIAAGVTALAAAALGGSALASAATSSTASRPLSAPSTPAASRIPTPGTFAHEDAERTVTGQTAAKARAAALRSVGGGAARAVTTDYTGGGFEVTVTKRDGAKVEVHLDSAYRVMRGLGGPPPRFGAPGCPPGQFRRHGGPPSRFRTHGGPPPGFGAHGGPPPQFRGRGGPPPRFGG